MALATDTEVVRLRSLGWKQRELAGFASRFGPLWTLKEEEGWAYGVLAGAEHLNPSGAVHGGALSALLDHALSTIAWQQLDPQPCVTVQLDMQFLGPANAGDFLVARGQVRRTTSSLVFMHGAVSVNGMAVVEGAAVLKRVPRHA